MSSTADDHYPAVVRWLRHLLSVDIFRMSAAMLVASTGLAAAICWIAVGVFGLPGQVWWIAIGFAGLVVVVILPLLIYMYGDQVSHIERMLDGGAWAHWTYDQGEWRVANRVEARRNRKSTLGSLKYLLPVAVVGGLIALAFPTGSEGRAGLLFAAGLTAGMGLLVSGILMILSTATLARTAKRGEIYFDPVGIYRRPGGFQQLIGFGQVLRRVDLHDGPPAHLSFECVTMQGSGSTSKASAARVVVPAGRGEEARQLVERFAEALESGRTPA